MKHITILALVVVVVALIAVAFQGGSQPFNADWWDYAHNK